MSTIFAPATAPGRAGVAVIRISGTQAGEALQALSGALPTPRLATLCALKDAQGEVMDRALVLWFPAPHSFTGEDVAELHLHGSRAVMARILDALGAMDGLRLAEPGEFSRRAFEHGKMDLSQAEGLADLIDAETEAQRAQAVRLMEGAVADAVEAWRAELVEMMAHMEAYIDFPEEDIPEEVVTAMHTRLNALDSALAKELDNRRGEQIRDGVHVAILGAPNAGKSTLLNMLARRDVAIVSDIAGTTRDVLEVRLDIDGIPVVAMDTAGLRDTSDVIELEGIRRAKERASQADIRLLLYALGDEVPAAEGADMLVANKLDVAPSARDELPEGAHAVSLTNGDGVEALMEALASKVRDVLEGASEPLVTRARHRQALHEAREAIALAQASLQADEALELVAEHMRLAARAVGRITGHIDVEELLDHIFSQFCIGK